MDQGEKDIFEFLKEEESVVLFPFKLLSNLGLPEEVFNQLMLYYYALNNATNENLVSQRINKKTNSARFYFPILREDLDLDSEDSEDILIVLSLVALTSLLGKYCGGRPSPYQKELIFKSSIRLLGEKILQEGNPEKLDTEKFHDALYVFFEPSSESRAEFVYSINKLGWEFIQLVVGPAIMISCGDKNFDFREREEILNVCCKDLGFEYTFVNSYLASLENQVESFSYPDFQERYWNSIQEFNRNIPKARIDLCEASYEVFAKNLTLNFEKIISKDFELHEDEQREFKKCKGILFSEKNKKSGMAADHEVSGYKNEQKDRHEFSKTVEAKPHDFQPAAPKSLKEKTENLEQLKESIDAHNQEVIKNRNREKKILLAIPVIIVLFFLLLFVFIYISK